jgi:hypothetical protein
MTKTLNSSTLDHSALHGHGRENSKSNNISQGPVPKVYETSFTRSECPSIIRGCICQVPPDFNSSNLTSLVRCSDFVSFHATQGNRTLSEHLFSNRLIKTNKQTNQEVTAQLTWLTHNSAACMKGFVVLLSTPIALTLLRLTFI